MKVSSLKQSKSMVILTQFVSLTIRQDDTYFLLGISKRPLPVLIPSFFNQGVAASTTDPERLVSPTTASLVFNGSKPRIT